MKHKLAKIVGNIISNPFLNAFSNQHGSVFDSKNPRKHEKWRFQVASNKWSIFKSIFYRFGLRFGSQFEVVLATFFVSKRPRRPPRRSKTLSRRSKTLPKTSRIAEDGPKGFQICPRVLRTSILVTPDLDFGCFLVEFLVEFGFIITNKFSIAPEKKQP